MKTLRAKMQEIQEEVGFTDDEITIIIFTSIDLSWLNNLIILAGEFTKWFNINFEGEGRDEIDFRDNKHENWVQTVHLGRVIVREHRELEENKKEQILKPDWWSHHRFGAFGYKMAAAFQKEPALLPSMRSMFKNQRDKLSYYDLF